MSKTDLSKLKTGVDGLYDALASMSVAPVIEPRSLTGDALQGGLYKNFQSTGIRDIANKQTLQVEDDGIHVTSLHTSNIVGNITFPGAVRIKGPLLWDDRELKADILAAAAEQASAVIPKLDYKSIPERGLSGNHLNGGLYTNFKSLGIKDNAAKVALVVTDSGIEADKVTARVIKTDNLLLDNASVHGDLTITGTFKAKKMHVEEITSDTRFERSEPLQFHPNKGSTYNNGLLWVTDGPTKQFVLHPNPDHFYSSEHINLHRDKEFLIGGIPMLTKKALGESITHSKLKHVGRLQNLAIDGNFEIDQYVFYSAVSNRLGFGVEEPNGTIGIAGIDNDFIIDIEDSSSKVGNYSSTPLNIITDNIARIQISATGNRIVIGSSVETKTNIQGKLGINVNSPDADIVTAGPVKFEGKKFSVGDKIPSMGTWNKGDIVWNQDPAPTKYVGWVCTRSGNPGEWKAFGQIYK